MKLIKKYLIIVTALLPILWACNDPLHYTDGKMHRVTIYLKNTPKVFPTSHAPQPAPCLTTLHTTSSELGTQNFPVTRTPHIAPQEEENRINSVQLYIFNSEGEYIQKITGNSSEYELTIPGGRCTLCCFVNTPELPARPSSAEELFLSESYLWNNNRESFQMTGTAIVDVDSDMELEILLRRIVAKVQCIIRRDFGNSHLANMAFTIQRIYLTNVAGKNNYALTAMQGDEGLWYNKMEYLENSCDNLICGSFIKKPLAENDSLLIGESLYPYPNSSEDCFDRTTWSARKTRLVIEATLGETLWYYPITLEKTAANTHYLYDITITREGVSHPEEPVTDPGTIKTIVKISEWNEGGEIDDEV